jgi:carboxymethylenebutenolidase
MASRWIKVDAGDGRSFDAYPEVIAAVRGALAANPKVQIHVYPGAKHAFANSHRASHDPAATTLAHRRTLEFFRAAVAAKG